VEFAPGRAFAPSAQAREIMSGVVGQISAPWQESWLTMLTSDDMIHGNLRGGPSALPSWERRPRTEAIVLAAEEPGPGALERPGQQRVRNMRSAARRYVEAGTTNVVR